MKNRTLGMLTPSSNTVVEPVTYAIVSQIPGVSAHFSRFPVTEISLSSQALAQFDLTQFLAATQLLADARMDVIAWNGTSAAWRGFAEDEALCDAIAEHFKTPATASMLALNTVMRKKNIKRFALVTPYIDAVQQKILDNYSNSEFSCIGERHSGISENFAFSEIAADNIAQMVRAVAVEKPDAILIVCTNLRSAPLVDALEKELKLPVYDSLSAVVWHALQIAGIDTTPASAWGSLFRTRQQLA